MQLISYQKRTIIKNETDWCIMSSKEKGYIKLTVTKSDLENIDMAVEQGKGRSRADLCYKALFRYLHDIERTTA